MYRRISCVDCSCSCVVCIAKRDGTPHPVGQCRGAEQGEGGGESYRLLKFYIFHVRTNTGLKFYKIGYGIM